MVNMGKSSRVKIEVEVTKMTKHDIKLNNRIVLGHLQLVQSVIPVEVKWKADDTCKPPPVPNKASNVTIL